MKKVLNGWLKTRDAKISNFYWGKVGLKGPDVFKSKKLAIVYHSSGVPVKVKITIEVMK